LSSFEDELEGPVRGWLDDGRAALGVWGSTEADPISLGERATAVLAELIAAAAPTPSLLVVEGVEGVDAASEAVLAALRSKAERKPWLVLATGGVDARGLDDSFTESVVLEPLDRETARNLVNEVGPRLRQSQIDRIIDGGRGNPLVLSELARNPHPGDQPDSLERLSVMQIDDLPVAARHLVREASAFGIEVERTVVAAVLGRPDLVDLDAWQETAPVVVEVRPGTMGFAHAAYRTAAYESLMFSERRDLHGAIADHLATRPDANPGVLAVHYEDAGRHREAFPLALEAARTARSVGALAEAGDFLERAARLAREVDPAELGNVLTELGDTRGLEVDFERAERAFAQAARILNDPVDYATMCSDRAGLSLRRGRYREARRFTRTGLVLTAPFADTEVSTRGRLLLDEAAALHFVGDNQASLRLAAAALRAGRDADDPLLEGRAHLHLEMVYSALGRPESRRHGEAAIETFAELGHDRYLTDALTNRGFTAMFAGEWNEAIDLYEQAGQAAGRTGDPVNAAIVEMNRGYLLSRQGRYGDAETLGRRALDVFDRAGLELHSAHARYLLSAIAGGRDEFDEAERLIRRARDGFDRSGDLAMVIDCDLAMMAVLLAAFRNEEALLLGDAVESRIDQADEPVRVTFLLYMGVAEARSSHAENGVKRIVEGLRLAKRRDLPYEEYLCLDELLDLETKGGPPSPRGTSDRRAELIARLGLVTSGR